MISLITAGIISCVAGLTVAKYKHALNQQSQKETIVIIKNANELGLQDQKEQHTKAKEAKTPLPLGRQWLYIPLPLPKSSEIRFFVIFISLVPFFGVLSLGLLTIDNIPPFLYESFCYTFICTLLFILFKIISSSHVEIATALKYVVIIVSLFASLYIAFEPNFRLLTNSSDDYILRIVILSSITSLASIVADPKRKR